MLPAARVSTLERMQATTDFTHAAIRPRPPVAAAGSRPRPLIRAIPSSWKASPAATAAAGTWPYIPVSAGQAVIGCALALTLAGTLGPTALLLRRAGRAPG
jgi:hypothetical protein